jgi:hypothetical protein
LKLYRSKTRSAHHYVKASLLVTFFGAGVFFRCGVFPKIENKRTPVYK